MTNVSKVYRRFRVTAVASPAGVFGSRLEK
jgi:hypothetical protein